MIDQDKLYEGLKSRMENAVRDALSVDEGPKKIKVNRIWSEDNVDMRDIKSQLDAKLKGRSWGIPIYADVSVHDGKTGKKISSSKKLKVMEIPKLTQRYSFIVDGEEFQVANQLRLRPGVYVKNRETRTSTSFKFPIGRSKDNFTIDYLPSERKWTVAVRGKTIPLYSYLNAMGVSEREISGILGERSLQDMKEKSHLKRDVAKLRKTILGDDASPDNLGENSAMVQDYMYSVPMDPEVVKMKYGKRYTKMDKGLLMDALKNMKDVLDGDEAPDIDSSRFKDFRTFDDILVERVEKSIPAIQRRIQMRMRQKDSARDIIQPEKISGIVKSFFNRSSLSTYPSQANPVNIHSGITRTTVFGEGAIGSKRALAKEERNIDPSMFGGIDPLHTVEGGDIGAVTHVTAAARKQGDALAINFWDPKTKKYVDVKHREVYDKVVAFPGEYEKSGSSFKPKKSKVYAIKRGKIIQVPPAKVDLVSVKPSDLFDFSSNLIPFLNSIEGGRGLMAAKMYDQAISLTDPDPAFVQSKAREGRSFDDIIGKTVTISSPHDGEIVTVGDDFIKIRVKGGELKTVQIYNDFPLNSKNYITSIPVVKKGDKVKKGQLLADSNFTKNGTLAIGKNLRTSWLPAPGHSVSGDTLVLWLDPDGMPRYGPIQEVSPAPGVHSPAVDPETLDVVSAKQHSFFGHHTTEKMWRIKTSSGTSVKATESHSFITCDEDGNLSEIKPEDIVPDETLVPHIAKVPRLGNLSEVSYSGKLRGSEITIPLNRDTGFLFGLYVAEGWAPKVIGFAAVEPEIIEKTISVLKDLGIDGVYKDLPTGDDTTHGVICCYHAGLRAAFRDQCGSGAQNKRVPDVLWGAPDEFVEGFVDGYWSGDGTATGKNVTAATTSEVLSKGLRLVLARLGIRTTARSYKGKNGHRDYYNVRAPKALLGRFPELTLSRKGERIRKLAESANGHSQDRIPIPRKFSKEVKKVLGDSWSASKAYASREILAKKKSKLPPAIQRLVDAPLYWDLVRSAEVAESEEYVYDLDMRPYGNFVVEGGLVVHNTFEDAILISESAAKKLTSSSMYNIIHEPSASGAGGKSKFVANYPSKFTDDQIKKLDSDGIIQEGQKVSPGDPLILYMGEKDVTPEDVVLGRISRKLIKPYSDKSQSWDEPYEGEVVRVVKLPNGSAKVYIKTVEPMQVGDKMSGRYAAKGLVGKILPDSEMPRDKDGDHVEVLLNPLSLPSRMNPGQLYEALAGKIAKKKGERYLVENFSGEDNLEKIREDLKSAGLSDTEELFDPKTGRSLGPVMVGQHHFLKLEHVGKDKFSARNPNNAYTSDLRPAKSGEGAQTIGHMEIGALLSHGASKNLGEMTNYKANRNDEFWRAIHMKEPLPPPEKTFAFEKLVNMLKGAGINVERRGTKFKLKPLTNDEISAMSAGGIKDSKMLIGKNMKPEKGGLFDDNLTGGISGKRWTHVDLPYEIPNPIFEPAIKGVLGITGRRFDEIMQEKIHVNETGHKVSEEEGKTGTEAVKAMLAAISIPKAISMLKEKSKSLTGSDLNAANRAMRFLLGMNKNKVKFNDLFVSKVPVLPPIYRPVYPLPDGTLNVSDVNYLYRDLVALRNQVKDLSKKLPQGAIRQQRADLYQAAKAVAGLGAPISSENYRGLVDIITGEGPKRSFFQSRVFKKRQEISGRAAIVGNPELGMDEVGIPEKMAWKIFHPFTIQKLVEGGYTPLEADDLIEQEAEPAKHALGRVMAERPVMVNRAPTLHKHGIMAMKPRLSPGNSVEMNSMVMEGMNADVDGDTVAVHVPATPQAVEEAWGMTPSANPFGASGKLLTTPKSEAQVGLYRLTAPGKPTGKKYGSEVDAVMDFYDGKIHETDVVTIDGKATTIGRTLVNKLLPPKIREPNLHLDKKKTEAVLKDIARNNPKQFATVADSLRDIGNDYAYLSGMTIKLDDLTLPKGALKKVFDKYDKMAAKAIKSTRDEKKLDKKIVEIYSKADKEINDLVLRDINRSGNNIGEMVASGARGSKISQIKQVVGAPVLMSDLSGKIHTHPVRSNYAGGMPIQDYWTAMYGSRKGHVDQRIATAEPGALTKSIVASSIDNRIIPGEPPPEERGLEFDVDDKEAVGRFIMKDIPGVAKRGDLFDSQMQTKVRSKRIKKVELGSPLMSTHPHGTYAMSYGLDEKGNVPKPGTFVGVMGAQAVGEPMTQLVLGSKHHGGVISQESSAISGFDRLDKLLTMPQLSRDTALVAKDSGVVRSVDKVPGGYEVDMGNDTLFTKFQPKVKRGQKIKTGDTLTEGMMDPRDVLETKGIDATRKYITDQVYDIFGGGVRKKHIETIVRSATDTALVTDSGNRTDFIEGDVVPINVLKAENRKKVIPMAPNLARNMMLMEEVKELGGLEKILTDEDIEKLKRSGKRQVMVNPEPVRYQPVLKGINLVPLQRKDWLSAMSFRHIGKSIRKAVAEGWESDVAGWNPIPGIAYGASLENLPSK